MSASSSSKRASRKSTFALAMALGLPIGLPAMSLGCTAPAGDESASTDQARITPIIGSYSAAANSAGILQLIANPDRSGTLAFVDEPGGEVLEIDGEWSFSGGLLEGSIATFVFAKGTRSESELRLSYEFANEGGKSKLNLEVLSVEFFFPEVASLEVGSKASLSLDSEEASEPLLQGLYSTTTGDIRSFNFGEEFTEIEYRNGQGSPTKVQAKARFEESNSPNLFELSFEVKGFQGESLGSVSYSVERFVESPNRPEFLILSRTAVDEASQAQFDRYSIDFAEEITIGLVPTEGPATGEWKAEEDSESITSIQFEGASTAYINYLGEADEASVRADVEYFRGESEDQFSMHLYIRDDANTVVADAIYSATIMTPRCFCPVQLRLVREGAIDADSLEGLEELGLNLPASITLNFAE